MIYCNSTTHVEFAGTSRRQLVLHGQGRQTRLSGGVSTNCEGFREMKRVKYAKYVGTMIGPEDHIHRWTAPRKNHPEGQKINGTSKSLVKRLVDFKVYALSVLGHLGSISAPDEATPKEEADALQCITADHHNAIPTDLLRIGSMCGVGLDILGIHTLRKAARYRTAANSGTLTDGLAKVQAAREHCAPWRHLKLCVA